MCARKDAGAVQQHQQDRQEKAAPEGEDELHDEVQVFLDAGQRLKLEAAVHALESDEPAECGGHDHKVGKACAHGEQDGGGEEKGQEGLFLARVEPGGDERPELVGDDRKADEEGGEQRDLDLHEKGAVELGIDQLARPLGKGAGQRPDQHREDAIGKIEAHAERERERVDRAQQAGAQFEQMIEQGRLGLVDIVDHAFGSVCGAGSA